MLPARSIDVVARIRIRAYADHMADGRRPGLLPAAIVVSVAVVISVAVASWVTAPRSRWVDPAAHVVDGYWFGAETVCPSHAVTGCAGIIETALAALKASEPGVQIVRASSAEPASAFFDRDGQATILWESGCCSYAVAILELDDGTRRLIGVSCSPMSTDTGGTTMRCAAGDGEITGARVGREPWLEGVAAGP